jgi:hypothetical protein
MLFFSNIHASSRHVNSQDRRAQLMSCPSQLKLESKGNYLLGISAALWNGCFKFLLIIIWHHSKHHSMKLERWARNQQPVKSNSKIVTQLRYKFDFALKYSIAHDLLVPRRLYIRAMPQIVVEQSPTPEKMECMDKSITWTAALEPT